MEVADPVQNNIVKIKVPRGKKFIPVGLCDFIYPEWSDPQTIGIKDIKFNYTDTLQSPFALSPGGYMVILDMKSGKMDYIFGKKVKQWVVEYKKKSYRTTERLKRYLFFFSRLPDS